MSDNLAKKYIVNPFTSVVQIASEFTKTLISPKQSNQSKVQEKDTTATDLHLTINLKPTDAHYRVLFIKLLKVMAKPDETEKQTVEKLIDILLTHK